MDDDVDAVSAEIEGLFREWKEDRLFEWTGNRGISAVGGSNAGELLGARDGSTVGVIFGKRSGRPLVQPLCEGKNCRSIMRDLDGP
jgi:hypothetical protein